MLEFGGIRPWELVKLTPAEERMLFEQHRIVQEQRLAAEGV